MSGREDGWPTTVSKWADAQSDIHALVQIGSRAQKLALVDCWSDFDYQLITSRPGKYRSGSFVDELGPCWAHSTQPTFGNVIKVIAVFDEALEADFVILRHVEVLIATFALRWPSIAWCWPRALRVGIENLRGVAAPGWKVIKGGPPWVDRYSRIEPFGSQLISHSPPL